MLIQKINVEKISNDYTDVVVTAYIYEKQTEKCTLSANIPYMNIKGNIPLKFNQAIKQQFKDVAEAIDKSEFKESIICTVSYKAYVQQNIISLVIRSELKEGTKSQKIQIKTFNYNFKEDKEVTLNDLLKLKNIDEEKANNKIKSEIKKIQEQNEALELALGGQASLYKRDYNLEKYSIQNTTEYFMGNDGMLYLIYPYGNNDYTNEMDIIIFK